MAITRITVEANDLVFDALAAGRRSGDLVLLLHGFPQSAEIWRPALRTLETAGYRAVAPDQRGYSPGAMPSDVDAYRLGELVEDARLIAQALGSTRFHLVGHDWGGSVAWSLAARAPELVRTLTVMSTPHTRALGRALRGTEQRARMAYVPALRAPMLGEALFSVAGGAAAEALLLATGARRSDVRRDVARMRDVGPSGALNWYRAIGRSTFEGDAEVQAPVLHIWGDRDVAFGRTATEVTHEYVSGPYHLVELTGGSHWIPDQHWDDVDDLVLQHLRAHPVSRPE